MFLRKQSRSAEEYDRDVFSRGDWVWVAEDIEGPNNSPGTIDEAEIAGLVETVRDMGRIRDAQAALGRAAGNDEVMLLLLHEYAAECDTTAIR